MHRICEHSCIDNFRSTSRGRYELRYIWCLIGFVVLINNSVSLCTNRTMTVSDLHITKFQSYSKQTDFSDMKTQIMVWICSFADTRPAWWLMMMMNHGIEMQLWPCEGVVLILDEFFRIAESELSCLLHYTSLLTSQEYFIKLNIKDIFNQNI